MNNRMDGQNPMLLDKLTNYAGTDHYPFHMPGHKRREELGITSFPNPFSVDITEIDGFDNLHHAEGMLKDSMERAAAVYGADRTYYMVNGSTGGILSAICGLTRPGGKIIMARNSHKAAYHAVLLNQLDPVYIYPDYVSDFGFQGGISPEEIEAAFAAAGGPDCNRKDIQAVFVTSPTYEGMVSDIGAIAQIAHRHGVPLIVDEAHGAHFSFGKDFPRSALDCGADVVIQSLHKTLPSLTQTALLHIKSKIIEPSEIEGYLPVFQTSSPSYVFLASIENCIRYMEQEGRERMHRFAASLERFMESAGTLKHLRLADDSVCGKFHIKDRDASKIVVNTVRCAFTGTEAAEILRRRFRLEPEMACGSYLLLMTSLMDTEDGFRRLEEALRYLDSLEAVGGGEACGSDDCGGPGPDDRDTGTKTALTWLAAPEKKRKLSEAWGSERRSVCLQDAAGAVSGGFITVYPPGVPMLVPGEVITDEALELILENQRLGLTVEGITEDGRVLVSGHGGK